MNRLTITVDLSDDVFFSDDKISNLLKSIVDVFVSFGVQSSSIDDLNIFQEFKKRYRS